MLLKNTLTKSFAILALFAIGGCCGFLFRMLIIDKQERSACSDMVKLVWKIQSFQDHIQSLDNKQQVEHLKESWPVIEKEISELYQRHKQTSFAFCFLYFKSPLVFESIQNLNLAFELFKDTWNKLATEDRVDQLGKAL